MTKLLCKLDNITYKNEHVRDLGFITKMNTKNHKRENCNRIKSVNWTASNTDSNVQKIEGMTCRLNGRVPVYDICTLMHMHSHNAVYYSHFSKTVLKLQ